MKKSLLVCTVFSLYLLMLLFPAACGVRRGRVHPAPPPPPPPPGARVIGPPPHAPAHGYRAKKHTYYYYPSEQVYFEPERQAYFYLEGGAWRVSVSLPESIRVGPGEHVTIEMNSDAPYTEFDRHRKEFPPGHLKKKKKR